MTEPYKPDLAWIRECFEDPQIGPDIGSYIGAKELDYLLTAAEDLANALVVSASFRETFNRIREAIGCTNLFVADESLVGGIKQIVAEARGAGLRELRDACYSIGRPCRLIQNATDFVTVVNEIDRLLGDRSHEPAGFYDPAAGVNNCFDDGTTPLSTAPEVDALPKKEPKP